MQAAGGVEQHGVGALVGALLDGVERDACGVRAFGAAALESLERRALLSVNAVFTPGGGVLHVLGDNLDNAIQISRDAAGKLLVNGGAVAIVGGTATVANTSLIQIFG